LQPILGAAQGRHRQPRAEGCTLPLLAESDGRKAET
jgi:hypothetical protein